VIIAIENQFGLKYFNGLSEDHVGRPFAGLEGYLDQPAGVRTFGRQELVERLRRHFLSVELYYPFPDYKIPRCVLDHEFLASGDCGEIVSQMESRSYARFEPGSWNEGLVSLELARNRQLPFFANSFLAVASDGGGQGCRFGQSAVLFAADRARGMRSVTRVLLNDDGTRRVEKAPLSGAAASNGPLRWVPARTDWQPGYSLNAEILRRCRNTGLRLDEIFSPCAPWCASLRALAAGRNGRFYLPGSHIDAIWSNYFQGASHGQFIDLEWEWADELPFNVVVLRAIHVFLRRLGMPGSVNRALRIGSGRRLIGEIAGSLGIRLADKDFNDFIQLEADFCARALGVDRRQTVRDLRWFLLDRRTQHAYIVARRRISGRIPAIGRVIKSLRSR
jgi:hypothetical protein